MSACLVNLVYVYTFFKLELLKDRNITITLRFSMSSVTEMCTLHICLRRLYLLRLRADWPEVFWSRCREPGVSTLTDGRCFLFYEDTKADELWIVSHALNWQE